MAISTKVVDKAYLLKQLKGYDSEIAAKKYVAQVEGSSLITATDLAKIGTNESAISGLGTLVGTLPATATSTTVVAYAKELADAAQEAATYDDTTVKAGIKANTDALDVLKGTEAVDGSIAKSVKDAIDDFATKVSDDSTVNTFKELVDYAASHNSEYSTLAGTVQGQGTAIETLNGTGAGSVSKSISDALGDFGNDAESQPYATAKAYIDAKAAEAQENATVEFETTDINFTTEWAS